MAESICKVDYFYAIVPNKPGEGARILSDLCGAGINLHGFSGFPSGARKAQLDFMPEDSAAFTKAARKAGLKLSKRKTGLLIQGDDRPGAVAEIFGKLAAAGINVTSLQGVSAGAGRYGAMLWVKTPDMRKAAKALGIK